jgi:hypothetical protein
MERLVVNERNLEAEEAATRLRIDQLRPARGDVRQGGAEIIDLKCNVMHTRPSLGEEPADGRLFPERSEELDATLPDAEGGGFDTLVLDRLTVLERGAEEADVGRDRLIQVVNRNAKVMDPARLH